MCKTQVHEIRCSNMNDREVPIVGSKIDKSQVPSIQQKRMVAFVNHFIVNTVTFLNKFIGNCETKFIAFESKLQKLEASLLIVEAKLESISGLSDPNKSNATPSSQTVPIVSSATETTEPANIDAGADIVDNANSVENVSSSSASMVDVPHTPDATVETVTAIATNSTDTIVGVKASEDVRYRKYFKMNQFGVPLEAVKIKMKADGFDTNILDDPNRILEDGMSSAPPDEE